MIRQIQNNKPCWEEISFVRFCVLTHMHARVCVCVAGELVAGDQGAIFTEAGKPRARTHGPTKCSVKTRSHSALEGKGFYSSRFRSGSESSKRGASFFAQVTFSERRNFKPHDEKIKVIFDTLTQLDHPNIVKLHKYWIDTKDEKKRVSPFCRCLGDFFFFVNVPLMLYKKDIQISHFFFQFANCRHNDEATHQCRSNAAAIKDIWGTVFHTSVSYFVHSPFTVIREMGSLLGTAS